MKNVLEAIDERFPCKLNIKFTKPHRRIPLTTHEGTLNFNSYIERMYDYVEVPYEIVKHIYELGWSDAKDEMKKELA
jgi:hypothetical protein